MYTIKQTGYLGFFCFVLFFFTIGTAQCYLKCEKNAAERNCEVAEQSFPQREEFATNVQTVGSTE